RVERRHPPCAGPSAGGRVAVEADVGRRAQPDVRHFADHTARRLADPRRFRRRGLRHVRADPRRRAPEAARALPVDPNHSARRRIDGRSEPRHARAVALADGGRTAEQCRDRDLNEVGGTWTKGPVDEASRIEPLREVLRKTRDGRGIVMVDRDNAEPVWFALRGGWHYRISRTGVVGSIVKDEHSHPGDCMGYGAARWFPLGKLATRGKTVETRVGNYYNAAP